MNLETVTTESLEAEIRRRKETHHLMVGGTVFDVSVEELSRIRADIDRILQRKEDLERIWTDNAGKTKFNDFSEGQNREWAPPMSVWVNTNKWSEYYPCACGETQSSAWDWKSEH